MKLIFKVSGQAPCLTEPPSQLINAGIALPPVKGECYCLSLSNKALIYNWLSEPGGFEGSTNYGWITQNHTTKQRGRELKQPDSITFHSMGGRGHFHLKFKAHLYIFLRGMGNTIS